MTQPVQSLLEDYYITEALRLLELRLRTTGITVNSVDNVKKYLTLQLAELPHESFGVLYIDVRSKLIADEILFRGTLAHVSIYPREIVKEALKHNAHSVVIYHNHPSGDVAPSIADHALTKKLKEALNIVDVLLVDHLIIAGVQTYSYSEHGQL